MKSIKMTIATLALCGMVACGSSEPKSFTGFIADASMNTVTVKDLTSDQTATFSTEEANMAEAAGMLIGSPVVVEYKGTLGGQTTMALKVTTDPTYYEAVGQWTTPDPLSPDSLRMGFELMVEGAAQSINMATLTYNAWELQGEAGKVILKGVSEGSGAPIEFTQIGVISKDAEGKYSLAIQDTDVVLTKE